MNEKFDLNEALEVIKAGAKMDGKGIAYLLRLSNN